MPGIALRWMRKGVTAMGAIADYFCGRTEKDSTEYTQSDLRIWRREVRDHDATGCDGKDFIEPWYGGLVCTKCGK